MRIRAMAHRARCAAGLVSAAALALIGAAAWAGDAPALNAFKRLDRNADGIVSFDEFVRASDERLARMDRNRDGDIGRDEFMAHHEAETRRRIDRIFAALDADRNGRLDPAELAGREDASRLLDCDDDKDGAVGRDEYLGCRRRTAERWMQQVWAKYDRNGDGFIGREERIAALRNFFRRLDADDDGKVERAEFAAAHKRWMERRKSPGSASDPVDSD